VIDTREGELDLALAAEVQAALLPRACPDDCPHQQSAARNRMCAGVGGDFYDFIRINDDQAAIVIGDVVGHGVRASLLMAQIMGYLRTPPPDIARPAKLISALNEMLLDVGRKVGKSLPCTLFYAVLDLPTGTMFFVNAGHPRPFLCDCVKCTVLSIAPRNLMLGVQAFEPEEGCHTFTPQERMVLHTDGVTDAVNEAGEMFGAERLHEAINRTAGQTPQEVVDAVFEALDAFRGQAPQEDDETLCVIDRV